MKSVTLSYLMFSERNIFVWMHLDIMPSRSGLLPTAGVKLRVEKNTHIQSISIISCCVPHAIRIVLCGCAAVWMMQRKCRSVFWCHNGLPSAPLHCKTSWIQKWLIQWRPAGCVYIQHQLFHPLLGVLKVDGRLCPLMSLYCF